MKTALQELIDDVKRMEQGLDVEELSAYVYKRATELLEKEREIAQEYAKQSKQKEVNRGFPPISMIEDELEPARRMLGDEGLKKAFEAVKPQPQEKVDEMIEGIEKKIFDYQAKNGFDTTFDFILEDLEQLKSTNQDKVSIDDVVKAVNHWAMTTVGEEDVAKFLNPKQIR